jgi:hypothetical protein
MALSDVEIRTSIDELKSKLGEELTRPLRTVRRRLDIRHPARPSTATLSLRLTLQASTHRSSRFVAEALVEQGASASCDRQRICMDGSPHED